MAPSSNPFPHDRPAADDSAPWTRPADPFLPTVRVWRLPGEEGTPAPPARPSLAGYEILRELGRGGMGVVYLAHDRALNRPVAIKMILHGGHPDTAALARFRAEAEAVARLQHPNIVQVHAIEQIEGRPYLVLEYCAGGSLAERLNGTPLPPSRAAALVETLARAMHHAHERGIVHRDLKPANILLPCSSLVPKIADFGLAKRLDQEHGPTCSDAILGTPCYMAPEQTGRPGKAPDPRTDVYALGAILYELITGRPPFKGETVLGTLEQVVRAEPVPPARLQPGCPRDLETIILTCLRKDPRQRYASALALAEDCAAFLRGTSIKARATPPWERAWKWARRRPAAAVLLAGACLSAVGLFAAVLWHAAELKSAVRQARSHEKAVVEAAQSDRARAEAGDLLRRAERAYAAGALGDALRQADKALAVLDGRPELRDLAARAERLHEECGRRLDVRHCYRDFRALRDEALFHASGFTGHGLSEDLRRTRTAARKALALFAAGGKGNGLGLTDRQRAEIRAGCYELHLALAEATAYPRPGESDGARRARLEEAIGIMRAVQRRGLRPTRAWYLRMARYLGKMGRGDEADRHRRRAASLEPTRAIDYYLAGEERRLRGDLVGACRAFESALALEPDHFWAQYSLAFCYLRRQRLPEAQAGLTACLARRPDFAWLHALRGFVHGERHDFSAADADFDRALALNPDRTTRYAVHANRGIARFRQAEAVASLAALQPVGPLSPLAAACGGAGAAYRARKLADAVDDLRAAALLRPGNYQAHASLALVYARQGKVDAARVAFTAAVRAAPALPSLYRARADFAYYFGDYAAARKDLERAIDFETPRSPARADDLVKLGQLLQRQRQSEVAINKYAEALAIVPTHAEALRLQAVVYLELRHYEAAASSFDRYLSRAAGQPGPRLAETYRLRGLTRTQLGRYEGALHDYTRALEIEPDAVTHAYRGWVYLVQGAPRPALADFEEALRRDAGLGDAWCGRGNARAKLGRGRAAVRDAEEALRRGPRSARMLHNAAVVYTQAAALERDPIRQRYQARALDLLRDALAGLPAARRAHFWGEQVARDPDLAPLRRLDRFRQMAPDKGG